MTSVILIENCEDYIPRTEFVVSEIEEATSIFKKLDPTREYRVRRIELGEAGTSEVLGEIKYSAFAPKPVRSGILKD